ACSARSARSTAPCARGPSTWSAAIFAAPAATWWRTWTRCAATRSRAASPSASGRPGEPRAPVAPPLGHLLRLARWRHPHAVRLPPRTAARGVDHRLPAAVVAPVGTRLADEAAGPSVRRHRHGLHGAVALSRAPPVRAARVLRGGDADVGQRRLRRAARRPRGPRHLRSLVHGPRPPAAVARRRLLRDLDLRGTQRRAA